MSLEIRVDLVHGRYDAGTRDPRVAEWPPHPARIHCALLAGARDDDDISALQWLEAQTPPLLMIVPATLTESVHTSFTVTNSVREGGGHQFHLAREAKERVRASVLPRTTSIALQ